MTRSVENLPTLPPLLITGVYDYIVYDSSPDRVLLFIREEDNHIISEMDTCTKFNVIQLGLGFVIMNRHFTTHLRWFINALYDMMLLVISHEI